MTLLELIPELPKVELHDHLDGGLRPKTIIELAAASGLALPTEDPEALGRWFHRGADRKDLGLYLEGFEFTVSLMQDEASLERVAREAVEDLAAAGAVYAEIRFAPILHTRKGLSQEAIVSAVIRGMEEGSRNTGMAWGLILCAMRNMGAGLSLKTAQLAVEFRDQGVVGFDIAGDEKDHPPQDHLAAFQFIRNENFTITIHAGEAFGPSSIWAALQSCGAHRIGHGTRLIEDMEVEGDAIRRMGSLAAFVRDRRVPLECCLSSNVQTGAAASLEAHPFRVFYRNQFRVALCVDNRLMSGTDLCKEMALAVNAFGLGLSDLEKLTINAMKSAFIGYDRRIELIYGRIKPGYAQARRRLEGS